MDTLERIHKLALERFNLWRKAGHSGLSEHENQRVQTLTAELSNLWDTHRREVASGSRTKTIERQAA